MTPVELAIKKFGGVRSLARSINRDIAAVSRWQKGKGTIPTAVQRKLLQTAWDKGIDYSPYEIIFGKE